MRKKILTLLGALGLSMGIAQKPPIKFGEIPMVDLKMTRYEKDSSASAVVLADYGETGLIYSQEKGFMLTYERLTRIKILTKEGLDEANFKIYLYHDGGNAEKISGLKAVTYNLENGKQVESKAKSESIFKEKFDENYDIMKVALPNVKEGSIVEISYKVLSDFITHFQDWDFQNSIPVRWSEYRARIPEYFTYDKYMQGYVQLTVNEQTTTPGFITITTKDRQSSGGFGVTSTEFQNDKIEFQEHRSRWVATDVPAFKEEPFMTTYKDYISRMNFELAQTQYPNQMPKNYMGSWQEINDRYVESDNFGGVVKGNGHLKQKVEELTKGVTDSEQKIANIHQYVRDNFLWDGTTRKFVDDNLRKVVDEKKGSSSEINLLLASMLEKAELEVYPVLISTRDNGFVRESLPVSTQFNHTICLVKVGEKQILLDATHKLLPTGILPERCLNGNGLVVSKKGFSWVKLAAPIKTKSSTSGDVTFSADGTFKGKLTLDRTGYEAEKERRKYLSKGEPDYVKDFIGSRPWEISKSSFENAKQLNASFKEVHELKINDHATVAGDMVYFNPLLGDKLDENPFKLAKREYPVDFGSPFDQTHLMKIMIPAGYKVEELPKAKALALPNGSGKFLYNAAQNGSSIVVTSTLQINRSLFSQEEYEGLREFYAQVVAKQAEQIVLKKI